MERQCKKQELDDFRQQSLGNSRQENDGRYTVVDKRCTVGDCNYYCELYFEINNGIVSSTSRSEQGNCQLEEYD